LVKNNNLSKKTDNKKSSIILVLCVIISVSALSIMFIMTSDTSTSDTSTSDTSTSDTSTSDTSTSDTSTSDTSTSDTSTVSDYMEYLSQSHTRFVPQDNLYFDHFLSERDNVRYQNDVLTPLDGIKFTFKESISSEFFDEMKSETNSVVIYPIFTAGAYQPNGFYAYYGGNCDESCITDLPFEYPRFDFNGSGATAQILFQLGYEFLTDVEVDKTPEILKNYDTVILLHNEYVTQNQFDAISSHPNLIFLFPNALYAEINVDYDDNTMTLIRGHNYPEESIANGFDYEIEERFHEYEYDLDCLTWEFVEIENGYHLNCYPDAIISENLEILIKLKELLNSN